MNREFEVLPMCDTPSCTKTADYEMALDGKKSFRCYECFDATPHAVFVAALFLTREALMSAIQKDSNV